LAVAVEWQVAGDACPGGVVGPCEVVDQDRPGGVIALPPDSSMAGI
jgi:hypothetical protein